MLVTGAAGFLGANLVRRLLREGFAVTAGVRPGGDIWRLKGCGANIVRLDLEDPAAIRATVGELRPRWIFSLAAHGGYSWQTDVERMVRVNVLAVAVLRDAAAVAGTERLVHAGSSSEYGFKGHPADERELLEPNSDYAATKAAATHLLRQPRGDGLRTCVLRVYSAYGPWEEPGRLVPTLLASALRGELPPLADPSVARDFVYVDDVVDAFVAAATAPLPHGAVLNVASGTQTTVAELVDRVRVGLGVTAEPEWGTMRPRAWDTSVWVGRPDRIRASLDWKPVVSLDDGLARTAAWLREHPALAARYA